MAIDERLNATLSEDKELKADNLNYLTGNYDEQEFARGVTDAMRRMRSPYTADAGASRLSDAEFAIRYPQADLDITMEAINQNSSAM